jgi:putative endonuclease
MSNASQARGRWGEAVAAQWYERRGAVVVERNWRVRDGEVDLIVADGDTLVFVEVKARRTDRFGTPVEAVGTAKAQRLRRLAAQYLREHPSLGRRAVRIDVVSVLGTKLEVFHDVG